MDDIVEKFLMEKLEKEIKEARDLEKTINKCKQLPVHKEWEELLNLLKQKKPKTGDVRREKLYDLLNLTTEWCNQMNAQQLLDPRALLPVDDISTRLKQVKTDLEARPEGESQIEQPSPLKHPQVYRWSCEANLTEIRGFNDKCKIMERLLLNEGTKVIGIVGVAGVGKTALAQLAYNNEKVREHFVLRIWLCLSKQQEIDNHGLDDDPVKRMLRCLGFEDQVIEKIGSEGDSKKLEDQVIEKVGSEGDSKKLEDQMIEKVGSEGDSKKLEVIEKVGNRKGGSKKLEVALRQQLNRGRYLIVLDDVWPNEKKDMDLFSLLKQHSSPGTLIVTSRSPELEKMVGAKNTHRLLPLEDDDSCWEIFSDAFKGEGDMEQQQQQLKKMEVLKPQIMGKCEGLPLMAKMLGKIGRLHQN